MRLENKIGFFNFNIILAPPPTSCLAVFGLRSIIFQKCWPNQTNLILKCNMWLNVRNTSSCLFPCSLAFYIWQAYDEYGNTVIVWLLSVNQHDSRMCIISYTSKSSHNNILVYALIHYGPVIYIKYVYIYLFESICLVLLA